MGQNATDRLREDYAQLRDDGEFWDWLGGAVRGEVEKLAEGRASELFFGGETTPLDIIFLIREWEKEVKWALSGQIAEALEAGHSWSQIAAALGTSRQAAVKRFQEWSGSSSAYQQRRAQGPW